MASTPRSWFSAFAADAQRDTHLQDSVTNLDMLCINPSFGPIKLQLRFLDRSRCLRVRRVNGAVCALALLVDRGLFHIGCIDVGRMRQAMALQYFRAKTSLCSPLNAI